MEDPPAVFIILSLIIFSGFFSLFDSALGACRKPRLQKESGSRYRPLLKALENPQILTFTCRFWINALRILAAVLAGINVMRFPENAFTGRFMAALIIAAAVLVLGTVSGFLGDALPKSIAGMAPENPGKPADSVNHLPPVD